MEEIDRFPLTQLPSRYGIARSALYTRLKDLKIEPAKDGNGLTLMPSESNSLMLYTSIFRKAELQENFSSSSRVIVQDNSGQLTKQMKTVQDSPGR